MDIEETPKVYTVQELAKQELTTKRCLETSQKFWDLLFDPLDIVEYRKMPSMRSCFASMHPNGNNNLNGKDVTSYRRVDPVNERKYVIESLLKSNKTRQDVFFGINPRTRIGGRSGKDTGPYRFLTASFKQHRSEVKPMWQACGLPTPTAVVSMYDTCLYFMRLSAPVTVEEWKDLQAILIKMTGCQPIKTATMMVHAPGFWLNYKQSLCRLVEYSTGSVITPATLREMEAFNKSLDID